ncbi:hypothetical protein N7535_001970 [Penicillium sp. DV-2018c]|nr:hypothetical protein N7535_001970 [Penicillium sp. DV-2018c]
MSYALETKKRKFHRLLDSLSKSSTPENASNQTPAAPATAQDRISANLSMKKVRLNGADRSELTAVRNSINKISRPAHRLASANSNKRPTFVPWDRERFLERLETFRRVDRWTSKPPAINEVQWAKHGWICTDVTRVTCVSDCGGSVVVKLPDEIDELEGFDTEKVEERKAVRARLVEEYANMLSSAHGESCPWRSKSCDATIQHLPLTNYDTALLGLHKRYTNISKMGDKLPANDIIQTPEGLELDGLIKDLPDEWFKETEEPTVSSNGETDTANTENKEPTDTPQPLNKTALALAVFGWDTASDGAAGLVGCGACFRRLGLWMYKPKDNGDVTVYTALDVANEHMEYCPWIDKVAQSGTGRPRENVAQLRPGWQLVAEAVKVKHRRRLRNMTSTDTLRPGTATTIDSTGEEENPDAKKKADREWWAKIRRFERFETLQLDSREGSFYINMDNNNGNGAPNGTPGRSDLRSPARSNATPFATDSGRHRSMEGDGAADGSNQLSNAAIKRRRLQERHQALRKRGRTPPSVFSRRNRSHSPNDAPPREDRRSRSPLQPRRSPSPEVPQQRKRPGGGARQGLVDRETLRRRQEERERAEQEEAMRSSQQRGVADVVRQHYNAVPERGREWRKTESKIKGLRSFNNWVKSSLIQKFSPDENFVARFEDTKDWANDSHGPPPAPEHKLLVLDLGCGKGGDLGKWQLAPQPVDLYVGLDPANVSIEQARGRYDQMRSGRGQRGRRPPPAIFHAEFYPKDCFGEWLGDIDIVQQVGIDANAGPGGSIMSSRYGGGGFDIVTSMFAIHYAFETEEKTRQMLSNVAGCLKKGGRFLGVCPNSDVISSRVSAFHKQRKEREAAKPTEPDGPEDGEVEEDERAQWGNDIYRVRFPGATPEDGVFRPPFGWKYSYFMKEAVEEVPEYVVPWEAFRALTEDYNLELQYRKPFLDIWEDEKNHPELGPLADRMGVRDRVTGTLNMTEEEKEAVSFYHAYCFYKV